MSQICKICHWRPSTILELAGRLLLRSLEQRQIEGWSWWQNWPILCALQLCCWVEDLNSNGLGSRPASMKMYKSRRNGRKSPKNRKLHLKCGGLRWTQWSKILFSPFLYIGMTIEFTWGWPKSWFFSFGSPPYSNDHDPEEVLVSGKLGHRWPGHGNSKLHPQVEDLSWYTNEK